MKIPYAEPVPAGSKRARKAKAYRDLATEVSRLHPQALTKANGEETDHKPCAHKHVCEDDKHKIINDPAYPANFTKGLAHNINGFLIEPGDYECFVEAINSPDSALFDKHVSNAIDHKVIYNCEKKTAKDKQLKWRGWESPRAGHVYELQGPDSGAVGMAPAPRVGSSELAAEMAEVYGLALLRDVRFTDIAKGQGNKICAGDKEQQAELSAQEILDELNCMPYFTLNNVVSSTPGQIDENGLNRFEHNRRSARTDGKVDELLTLQTIFRGSAQGAEVGPYISQFMLVGSTSRFPGNYNFKEGLINYGTQVINQKVDVHKGCLDYMTDWSSWLDVQNGADFGGLDLFEQQRRFITTPRDLATYVHYDALYQAYLNACLILLGDSAQISKGFPEPSIGGKRAAFATYGGPHILSLVTEVATRCLKAVRRQKFNYHRRARPEAMGGRLTLVGLNKGAGSEHHLGCGAAAFEKLYNEIPADILKQVAEHNTKQNSKSMQTMRKFECEQPVYPKNCKTHLAMGSKFSKDNINTNNFLLPMAFPEGSPMHPAYGAGHATVAGGCVTMLKAFFEMFDYESGCEKRRIFKPGNDDYYVPSDDGSQLQGKNDGELTIQGELNKLAANISIGRNMAGVHYYSDYYDSLRMGERVAVGILMEQAPAYGELMEVTFDSFDGDRICIQGEAGSCPSLSILGKDGRPVRPEDWWLRHVPGEQFTEDL